MTAAGRSIKLGTYLGFLEHAQVETAHHRKASHSSE